MKKISIIIALCLFLNACSAFRSSTQMINVKCEPQEDVMLMVNGNRVPCPSQMDVRRDRGVAIQAYKKGYVPYSRTIGYHLNETGVLDIVGTVLILLPGIGLFTAGAWSLDETDIPITLYRE